jgi:hypothetical protein
MLYCRLALEIMIGFDCKGTKKSEKRKVNGKKIIVVENSTTFFTESANQPKQVG